MRCMITWLTCLMYDTMAFISQCNSIILTKCVIHGPFLVQLWNVKGWHIYCRCNCMWRDTRQIICWSSLIYQPLNIWFGRCVYMYIHDTVNKPSVFQGSLFKWTSSSIPSTLVETGRFMYLILLKCILKHAAVTLNIRCTSCQNKNSNIKVRNPVLYIPSWDRLMFVTGILIRTTTKHSFMILIKWMTCAIHIRTYTMRW